MTNNLIIVAGGKGMRMGTELPKQFIPIDGKPILMRTIDQFYAFDKQLKIILVLPKSHQDYWAEICTEHNFNIPHLITYGGETRFHSVKNGLALVESGLVAVHDAARPFVSSQLIKTLFDLATTYKAVIPFIDATDSLREITGTDSSRIIDRSKIKLIQTPQIFCSEILKKAYQREYSDAFTDDASVVEAYGQNIHLHKGEESNIKITTPLDLSIAEAIIKREKQKEQCPIH